MTFSLYTILKSFLAAYKEVFCIAIRAVLVYVVQFPFIPPFNGKKL